MTTNALTRARAEMLLSAYGANPMHWPTDERDAMHMALQQWPELKELMEAEQVLDSQLSASVVPSVVSFNSILARIDEYPVLHDSPTLTSASAVADKTHEGARDGWGGAWQWWQVAIAACLPLALGVGLGMSSIDVIDDWQGSEQYLFAPSYEEFING